MGCGIGYFPVCRDCLFRRLQCARLRREGRWADEGHRRNPADNQCVRGERWRTRRFRGWHVPFRRVAHEERCRTSHRSHGDAPCLTGYCRLPGLARREACRQGKPAAHTQRRVRFCGRGGTHRHHRRRHDRLQRRVPHQGKEG